MKTKGDHPWQGYKNEVLDKLGPIKNRKILKKFEQDLVDNQIDMDEEIIKLENKNFGQLV